jgi:4-alpha-glucanotransferase
MPESRASGILLHITSLPSEYGIGDFGPEAYKFVDFLARARQSYWQVLPLNPPTLTENPYSPYNCLSAFAGNTMLISPELLYRQGLLSKKYIQEKPDFPEGRLDYRTVISYKTKLLDAAFERFRVAAIDPDYRVFCSENTSWLEDFAIFAALRRHFRPRVWCNWPLGLRDRNKQVLGPVKSRMKDAIDREKFLQYIFFQQWFSLKDYCNRQGIEIIGDIPFYVAYDSADVWAHARMFRLTRTKKARVVGGVPPDLFSRTGQLWGNPVYDWQALRKTGYRWWLQRMEDNLTLFDIVRLDHFRGFIAYWEVPARCKTAVNGRWVDGPKEDFFDKLFESVPAARIIVEDLGYITADVRAHIKKYGLASMKVLQFAFDGEPDTNPHWLSNHVKNSVVYTGTHDNNTVRGWFEKEANVVQKRNLFALLGRDVPADKVHWELIRLAMSSVGNIVIIPMQDVLGLGQVARMNRPATVRGNWCWRLRPRQVNSRRARKLAELTEACGRA